MYGSWSIKPQDTRWAKSEPVASNALKKLSNGDYPSPKPGKRAWEDGKVPVIEVGLDSEDEELSPAKAKILAAKQAASAKGAERGFKEPDTKAEFKLELPGAKSDDPFAEPPPPRMRSTESQGPLFEGLDLEAAGSPSHSSPKAADRGPPPGMRSAESSHQGLVCLGEIFSTIFRC